MLKPQRMTRPAQEVKLFGMINIHEKLEMLGLTLPTPPKPVASYIPAVTHGDTIHVSGQLPMSQGELIAVGPVPSECTLEDATAAARQALLNGLAVIDAQLDGDWSRFVRLIRVGVYVLSETGFGDQPKVANGASELAVEILGEAGRHARAAVGTNALPLNASVELELTVGISP